LKFEQIATDATFLLFGTFGNISSSLTWILYLIALNKDCQQKLFEEIDQIDSDEQVISITEFFFVIRDEPQDRKVVATTLTSAPRNSIL